MHLVWDTIGQNLPPDLVTQLVLVPSYCFLPTNQLTHLVPSSDTSDTICTYPLAINRIRFGPQLTPKEGSYHHSLVKEQHMPNCCLASTCSVTGILPLSYCVTTNVSVFEILKEALLKTQIYNMFEGPEMKKMKNQIILFKYPLRATTRYINQS